MQSLRALGYLFAGSLGTLASTLPSSPDKGLASFLSVICLGVAIIVDINTKGN